MSLDDGSKKPAAETGAPAFDSMPPDAYLNLAQRRAGLFELLKETESVANLNASQYLALLMTADRCGLLTSAEYRVFGDLAALNDDDKIRAYSMELRNFLLEKIKKGTGTVDAVRSGVSAEAKAKI